MYDFHYNHMKVNYPHANQLRLLFTYTDSLAYAVQTDYIYMDMAVDAADRYYFSEYPLDHPLYDASNQLVVLQPKCYASLCTGKVDKNVVQHTRPVERKIAKGGKRKVKDDQLQFNHYLDALRNFQTLVCKQNLISSTAHTVRTVHNQTIGPKTSRTVLKKYLLHICVSIHFYNNIIIKVLGISIRYFVIDFSGNLPQF